MRIKLRIFLLLSLSLVRNVFGVEGATFSTCAVALALEHKILTVYMSAAATPTLVSFPPLKEDPKTTVLFAKNPRQLPGHTFSDVITASLEINLIEPNPSPQFIRSKMLEAHGVPILQMGAHWIPKKNQLRVIGVGPTVSFDIQFEPSEELFLKGRRRSIKNSILFLPLRRGSYLQKGEIPDELSSQALEEINAWGRTFKLTGYRFSLLTLLEFRNRNAPLGNATAVQELNWDDIFGEFSHGRQNQEQIRAGFLEFFRTLGCFPSGQIRWADVIPTDQELLEAVSSPEPPSESSSPELVFEAGDHSQGFNELTVRFWRGEKHTLIVETYSLQDLTALQFILTPER